MRGSRVFLAACSIVGAAGISVAQTHHHVVPGSFLGMEYSSKSSYLEALRERPAVVRSMAECYHTSPDNVIDCVDSELVLGHLKHSGTYIVWGRSKSGRVHRHWQRMMKGEKVWETKDGKPVVCWSCSNPMGTQLPQKAAAEVVPPPPPPPPPPVTPPPPPPPPEPTPPPPPPPEPTPPPPPPPEPTPPPPPPPPPPAPTPPPPPPPPPVVQYVPQYHPWRLEVGDIMWTDAYHQGQGIFTAGVSYDAWHWHGGTNAGAYFDYAGLQDHPTYRFYGGGVFVRQFLTNFGNGFGLYVGAGAGAYHIDIRDQEDVGKTQFGGKVFLGVDLPANFFIEAQYNIFGKDQFRDLSTFGASIGYRF